MIRTLAADEPHRSLGEQARVFDRFIGTWRAQYRHFAPDGSLLEEYGGRVLFGWILEGRAVQDIWIWDPSGERTETAIGTSVRFYDDASGKWRVVYVAPQFGALVSVEGGQQGDRIVLEGTSSEGWLRRWSFNEIRDDSFVWRGERSDDGGASWWLTAEYRMHRDRFGGGRPQG